MLLGLNRLGLLDVLDTPLLRFGRRRIPSELSREPKCDWLALKRDGQRLEASTVEGRGDYRMTVAAALAFVEAVLERPPGPGACRAQDVFSISTIRPKCEARGIRFVNRTV